MINALAENRNMSFFQILGDNFYDQDGRLTRALFDSLSLDVKSKIFMTVAGNHDLWVCGGPSCGGSFFVRSVCARFSFTCRRDLSAGDEYDQSGYGLMQFYGQDPLASALSPQTESSFLSFSVVPVTSANTITPHLLPPMPHHSCLCSPFPKLWLLLFCLEFIQDETKTYTKFNNNHTNFLW